MLGQLTQLKQLGLDWVPGFTDAGLEQLTNLDLAHLILHDAQVSEAIGPDEDGVVEFMCSVEKGERQPYLTVCYCGDCCFTV